MLAEGGVNDTHVKEDLGRIGDLFELAQCLVEFIVVILRKGCDPALYFLIPREETRVSKGSRNGLKGFKGLNRPRSRCKHTCFSDMATKLLSEPTLQRPHTARFRRERGGENRIK